MKKSRYLIFSLLLFFLFIGIKDAASLSVSTSKSTVVVGNTVNVTISASGAAGWEYCLSFDDSLFSLTGAPTDTGGKCVLTGSTLIGYSKVTFTLKAKKSGTGTVGLSNYAMYDDNGAAIGGVSAGSVKITAKTQAEIEASYSTNDNLKSITIEGYEIDFKKDVLEYSLEVENNVESVNISALREDSRSRVSGDGVIALLEGNNRIEIVVTAEKGNTKKYVININRKELNPINVKVDGKDLTVVRKADMLEAPTYYTATTVMIDDNEVPAFSSEITGYVLVALKDNEGNISYYSYKDNKYVKYDQLSFTGLIFSPIIPEKLLDGYENKQMVSISDIEVTGYQKNKDDSFILVYGMNVATGKVNWYKYDKEENTLQRFLNDEIVKLEEDLKDYYLLIIVFAMGLGLSLLLVIMLFLSNSKTKKKNSLMYEMLEKSKKELEKKDNIDMINNQEEKGKTKSKKSNNK